MKIRCEHNSIRLRLRKSELVQLRAEEWLEACIHFPGGQLFAWELTLSADRADITAQFEDGRVRVFLPSAMAYQWMDTNEVGVECYVPVGEGAALHILVEKDFPCKVQAEESRDDFFTELAEEAPVNC